MVMLPNPVLGENHPLPLQPASELRSSRDSARRAEIQGMSSTRIWLTSLVGRGFKTGPRESSSWGWTCQLSDRKAQGLTGRKLADRLLTDRPAAALLNLDTHIINNGLTGISCATLVSAAQPPAWARFCCSGHRPVEQQPLRRTPTSRIASRDESACSQNIVV